MADLIPTVGFVGIGAMGLPLAERVLRSGTRVRAVDASPARVAQARASGIEADTDPAVLVGVQVTFVLVATGAQLLDLLSAAPFSTGDLDGTVVVVMSTVGPEIAVEAERLAAGGGVGLVDSPVTGGVVGAQEGRLTLFVSGSTARIESLAPLMKPMGSVQVVGESVGNGQAFKLVNQLMAGVHLAAAAEALGLAEHLGLDLARVLELLPTGTAASWMLSDRGPRMVQPASRRPVQTHLDIFVKDTDLVVQAASAVGCETPLADVARGRFQQAAACGWGAGDDAGVFDLYRRPPNE